MGIILSLLIVMGILALAVWALVSIRRDRKNGNCGCAGCGGCPMAGNCNKPQAIPQAEQQKEKNDHDEQRAR